MPRSGKKTSKRGRAKKSPVKDLTARDAKAVKGGATDIFAKLGGIKGESRSLG